MPPRRPGDPGYQGNVTGETQQAPPSSPTSRLDRLRAELAEKRDSVAYLQELWELLFADCEAPTLSTSQALVWLKRFDVMIAKAALERTQEWLAAEEADKSLAEVLAYASGCMYKMRDASEAGK